MTAREAFNTAERFLHHTRLARDPDAVKSLQDAKERVTRLESMVRVALESWDAEQPIP